MSAPHATLAGRSIIERAARHGFSLQCSGVTNFRLAHDETKGFSQWYNSLEEVSAFLDGWSLK